MKNIETALVCFSEQNRLSRHEATDRGASVEFQHMTGRLNSARWALLAPVIVAALSALAACAGQSDERTVSVFAAASLTNAFTDIAAAFEAENPGTAVVLNLGSSSSLREQILSGAPANVFASASDQIMASVIKAGNAATPRTFATNRLAIAVPVGNPAAITGIEDFARPELLLGVCAIGVPCGDLARRVFELAAVTAAIDTNENDVQALVTRIEADELDAGLVYQSDVATNPRVERIDLPDAINPMTVYPITTFDGSSVEADAFVSFVIGPIGRRLLSEHGFGSP